MFKVGDKVKFSGKVIASKAYPGRPTFCDVIPDNVDSEGNLRIQYFEECVLSAESDDPCDAQVAESVPLSISEYKELFNQLMMELLRLRAHIDFRFDELKNSK